MEDGRWKMGIFPYLTLHNLNGNDDVRWKMDDGKWGIFAYLTLHFLDGKKLQCTRVV